MSQSHAEAMQDDYEFAHGHHQDLICPACGEFFSALVFDGEELTYDQAQCPACGESGDEL